MPLEITKKKEEKVKITAVWATSVYSRIAQNGKNTKT